MKYLSVFILPALATTLIAEPAVAGDPTMRAHSAVVEQRRERLRQKRERQFREADVDGSRSLTRGEIEVSALPRVLLERFDEIDTDADGTLSPAELEALQARRVQAAREGGADD